MPVIDRPPLLEHLIAIELVVQNRGGHVAPKDACLSGNPARSQAQTGRCIRLACDRTRRCDPGPASSPRPLRNGPTLLSLGINPVYCANSPVRSNGIFIWCPHRERASSLASPLPPDRDVRSSPHRNPVHAQEEAPGMRGRVASIRRIPTCRPEKIEYTGIPVYDVCPDCG